MIYNHFQLILTEIKGCNKLFGALTEFCKALTSSEINLLFYKSTKLFLCSNLILRKLKVIDRRVLKKLFVLDLTTLVKDMK